MQKVGAFYVASQNEARPGSIEVEGKVYWRFMDYIYHTQRYWEWSSSQVQAACRIRRTLGAGALNGTLNRHVAKDINLHVRKHFGLVSHHGSSIGIELGCGEAIYSSDLCADIDAAFIGLDIDAEALIRRRYHDFAVCADMAALPFESGEITLCLALFVFHFGDTWRGLSEIARVLRPRGLLGVNCYGPLSAQLPDAASAYGLKLLDTETSASNQSTMIFLNVA